MTVKPMVYAIWMAYGGSPSAMPIAHRLHAAHWVMRRPRW